MNARTEFLWGDVLEILKNGDPTDFNYPRACLEWMKEMLDWQINDWRENPNGANSLWMDFKDLAGDIQYELLWERAIKECADLINPK